MAIIAPLALADLDEESRARIEEGQRTGMFSQTLPLQIMARAPAALRAMDEGYKAMFRCSLLDDRLRELLRLYSTQVNGCGPCSQSRKEDSVSGESAACLATAIPADCTLRERAALDFMALMIRDHFAISREVYVDLAKHFTTAEIVELGWTCAQTIAGHRFMASLDLHGSEPPVLG